MLKTTYCDDTELERTSELAKSWNVTAPQPNVEKSAIRERR